jgi:methyl-accepting chemotaxis protein|uniref:t-SNARE coiled-coil homology domain-containing protein n=1 Tax=Eutreptiella gymnastica TaxID=73025 RepID=A0A7S4FR51_9EUGL|mmetsp:Transcript_92115/g.154535  ORF Transcript_92115/g.154535 Transcript_92115/m.154535 type:complete len:242 (-) Transcript_92115:1160-1885(-)
MQDPYEAVKEEVVNSVNKLEALYQKWKSTEDPTQLVRHHSKLLDSVRNIEGDLNDLGDAIKVVLANRRKFENLTDSMIDARRQFIDNTRGRIRQIKEEINNPQNSKSQAAMSSPKGTPKAGGRTTNPYAHLQEESDTTQFIEGHMQAQAEMEMSQEETLEDLTHAVQKLKSTGVEIRDELQNHDKLIDELGEEMDTLQGKMKHAAKQLEKAMDEAGQKTKLCVIVFLIVVLLILTFIFFTF